MILLYIVLSTFLIGLISFIGVVFFGLRLNVRKITSFLISAASGLMLGAAFFHLIPESLRQNQQNAMVMIPAGLFFFFILEKFLIWRHCHTHQRPEDHSKPVAAKMILAGDAIHNFLDGIIIASAYHVSVPVGHSITMAILLHEIPQEMGDFGVLLHGGYSFRKALLLNAMTASLAIIGGIIGYFFIQMASSVQAFIIPISAGGFLYIALADLIPQLHDQTDVKSTLIQVFLLGLGFSIIGFLNHHAF